MSDDYTLKTYRRKEQMKYNVRLTNRETGESRMMKVDSDADLDDVVDALQQCWDEHGEAYLNEEDPDQETVRWKVATETDVTRDMVDFRHVQTYDGKHFAVINVEDREEYATATAKDRRTAIEDCIDKITKQLQG